MSENEGGLSPINKAKIPEGILIIEAPPLLSEGEDFYSQEPFKSVVEDASSKFGISQEKTKAEISFIAKGKHWWSKPAEDHPDYKRWTSYEAMLSRARPYVQYFREALEPYPYWYEYVATFLDASFYANDGTFRVAQNVKKPFNGTVTYANWVTKKLRREALKQQAAIDEVLKETFPDFFGQPQTSLYNVTGRKRRSRYWGLMKATNLVPEKR